MSRCEEGAVNVLKNFTCSKCHGDTELEAVEQEGRLCNKVRAERVCVQVRV